MRYRRLSYRYAMVLRTGPAWPASEIWVGGHLRLLVEPRWRPDVDAWETATRIELLVELAGVDEDDVEVQLFDDALVVEGHRRLPPCEDGVYQQAGIRQGPFRVEVPLSAPVDAEQVEIGYDRGLLRVTLPKRRAAR